MYACVMDGLSPQAMEYVCQAIDTNPNISTFEANNFDWRDRECCDVLGDFFTSSSHVTSFVANRFEAHEESTRLLHHCLRKARKTLRSLTLHMSGLGMEENEPEALFWFVQNTLPKLTGLNDLILILNDSLAWDVNAFLTALGGALTRLPVFHKLALWLPASRRGIELIQA